MRQCLILTALLMSSCAPNSYQSQYGQFYSPVDAACGHLYQPIEKERLASNWEKEMASCRTEAMGMVTQQARQTQQDSEAYRQFGMQMLAASAQENQAQPPPMPVYVAPQPVTPVHTTCSKIGDFINCSSM